MDSYSEMLGGAQQPIQQTAPQPQGYAGVTQQMDPTMQQIARPAASPEEVQQRVGLWQQVVQKFQTDPNLKQAFMMMGAHLAQPNQPGQTTMGHIGQSLALGSNVYNAGEYSQYEQQRQAQEDARKQAESQASVASTQAQTANTKAGTPGVAARSAVDVGSVQSKIDQAASTALDAKAKAGQAALSLETELKDVPLKDKQRAIDTRMADIKNSISDPQIKAAFEAEFKTKVAQLGLVTAQTASANASAAANTAAADEKKLETADMQSLTPEQRMQVRTKTGDYSPMATTDERRINALGKMYEGLPADDPAKVGKNKAQFVAAGTKQFQQKDFLESYAKLAQTMSPQDLQESGLTDLLHEVVAQKAAAVKGTSGTPTPSKVPQWGRDAAGKPVLLK